jgi:hypothetical protein
MLNPKASGKFKNILPAFKWIMLYTLYWRIPGGDRDKE